MWWHEILCRDMTHNDAYQNSSHAEVHIKKIMNCILFSVETIQEKHLSTLRLVLRSCLYIVGWGSVITCLQTCYCNSQPSPIFKSLFCICLVQVFFELSYNFEQLNVNIWYIYIDQNYFQHSSILCMNTTIQDLFRPWILYWLCTLWCTHFRTLHHVTLHSFAAVP